MPTNIIANKLVFIKHILKPNKTLPFKLKFLDFDIFIITFKILQITGI